MPYRESKFTTSEEIDAFNDLFVTFINRGPRDLLTPRATPDRQDSLKYHQTIGGRGGQRKQTGAFCLLLSRAEAKLNLSIRLAISVTFCLSLMIIKIP